MRRVGDWAGPDLFRGFLKASFAIASDPFSLWNILSGGVRAGTRDVRDNSQLTRQGCTLLSESKSDIYS